MSKPPIQKRPMTEDEQTLCRLLGGCTFTPASFDKRFARTMYAASVQTQAFITEKQAALLREKVTRYRRQIDARKVPVAEQALLVVPPKQRAKAAQRAA